MNKYIRNAVFFTALIFGISLTAVQVSAQQMTGAYGAGSVSSKDTKAAASFAVKARAKKIGKHVTLLRIRKADQQIVAGINYRLCMDIREGSGKVKKVTAVVYEDLKHHRSLSRWESGGCKEL